MSGLPKIELIPGWDCYDWRNARTILEHGHPSEWRDVIEDRVCWPWGDRQEHL